MDVRSRMGKLVGRWAGTNRLWLSPDEPARESETEASIALAAGDAFVTIAYTWADEGRPQDGLLVVRTAPQPGPHDMTWIDSFHTARDFMLFGGEDRAEGRLSALGSYPAPPGPDWGWRIVLEADTPHALRVLMTNIAPDGEEALAVEAHYARAQRS